MSDGPYRSLPMSRGWKLLAEFADNRNFDPSDVCKAVVPALTEDWHFGVPDSVVQVIRQAFLDQQGELFAQERDRQIELLRGSTPVHGLARLLVDCADAELRAGGAGVEALAGVGRSALEVRAARGVRQVEEHYHREGAPVLKTKDVRARLEEGIRGAPLESLGREFLGIGPAVPRSSLKHDDVDDGVPL